MPTPRFFLRSLASTIALTLVGAGLHFSALHAATATAPSFPNKPVRIIVPVAAGGSADKLTRTLAERLSVLLSLIHI